jgi:hypothetical protein
VNAGRHPGVYSLLRWFDYEHLPEHLRDVSGLFYALAHQLVASPLPDGPELTTALRKLLEAKDCAVRAAIEHAELQAAAEIQAREAEWDGDA